MRDIGQSPPDKTGSSNKQLSLPSLPDETEYQKDDESNHVLSNTELQHQTCENHVASLSQKLEDALLDNRLLLAQYNSLLNERATTADLPNPNANITCHYEKPRLNIRVPTVHVCHSSDMVLIQTQHTKSHVPFGST